MGAFLVVEQQVAQPLPPAPRPMTPRVRRRAWAEPRVRFGWLLAAVLFAIGAGFILNGFWTWHRQAWLIAHGTLIQATVYLAGGDTVKNKMQPGDSAVILDFTWNGQKHRTAERPLEGRTKPVVIGGPVPIHVNPNDPDEWTPLDRPLPLLQEILGGIIALPIAMVAFAASLLTRARVLRLWRTGSAMQALVVDSQNTALAPLSRAVRCTPDSESDARVFTVFVPPRLGKLKPGETLWIICSPGKNLSAQAAAWFE